MNNQIKILHCFVCYVALGFCKGTDEVVGNLTGPKDMYVVRATVYQVGILTNRTNETTDLNAGRQEALTIYHNNGSNIDFSKIPGALLTNVTAEKVLGVAPVTNASVPWKALQKLMSTPRQGNTNDADMNVVKSKRETSTTPVEIIKGAAVIPPEARVNAIALPPLLTLNKNITTIPVPIPNVSVVSYAKINTLVRSP